MPSRAQLLGAFWRWVPPSLEGYSHAIHDLLKMLTDEQLDAFVCDRASGECPECGADIPGRDMHLPCSECGTPPPKGDFE